MVRPQVGIILCLLSLLILTSTASTEESILGTVRLRDNRLIFQNPSTATAANTYVTVACPTQFGDKAMPSNNPVQPLVTARSGELLTILEISHCHYTDGDYFAGRFVKVRTAQGIVGYTQLPNYHNLVEPANDTGALYRLYLDITDCGNDPECYVNHALPYRKFIREYPPSQNTGLAANMALWDYLVAAKLFITLASNPEVFPEVSARYAQYDRKTLAEKAHESLALKDEMHDLREKYLYPENDDNRLLWLIVFIVMLTIGGFCYFKFNAVQKTKREFQKLVNIEGADSWEIDDIDLRIYQLERILKPEYDGDLKSLLKDPKKRYETEDAIYRLKQTAERKRRNDTSFDTIIGFERD